MPETMEAAIIGGGSAIGSSCLEKVLATHIFQSGAPPANTHLFLPHSGIVQSIWVILRWGG
jgi:hypothetical protein